MKIKIVLMAGLIVAFSSIAFAQSETKTITPDVVVKNLYAAHNSDRSPFNQTENRALIDKFFTKEFANLIWKEAVEANAEGGVAIDVDPLYNAQDTQITAFKIGKPVYGEGNREVADVAVTFKNFGKAQTILFRLEQAAGGAWKISNIQYPGNDQSYPSLKDFLSNALAELEGNDAPEANTTSGIRSVDFLNFSYRTSVCSEDVGLPKTVKVLNGKFKGGDNFYEVTKKEIFYGDVNSDGSEDAIVLIRCGSAAGTLRAFEIHAYSFRNDRANLLALLDSTVVESDYQKSYPDGIVFYAGENPPKLTNGHLIVEALTDGSFAAPENVATFDYKLSGGKFVLSGKPTRKKRPE